jgi:hypothetical protein
MVGKFQVEGPKILTARFCEVRVIANCVIVVKGVVR